MPQGPILIIILVIILLGGFRGRFRSYGYSNGPRGGGVPGLLVIIVVVLLVSGRI